MDKQPYESPQATALSPRPPYECPPPACACGPGDSAGLDGDGYWLLECLAGLVPDDEGY